MNEDDQDRADEIVGNLRNFKDHANGYHAERREPYIRLFGQDAALLLAEIDRLRALVPEPGEAEGRSFERDINIP